MSSSSQLCEGIIGERELIEILLIYKKRRLYGYIGSKDDENPKITRKNGTRSIED